MSITLHEVAYRGSETIEKLSEFHITFCGLGTLGSLLVNNLVRQGASNIRIIDFDRVEEHNIGTQIYTEQHIGQLKTEAVLYHCYHINQVVPTCFPKRLTDNNIHKCLSGTSLVVDAFDNKDSREIVASYCLENDIPCLHLGMNGGYGDIHWNDGYVVPDDVTTGDDCDYPLARNLALLVTAVSSEAIMDFIVWGKQRNYSVTLKDLSINHE